MAEPLLASLTPHRHASIARAPSVGASVLIVIGFWWAATGLTFGMQWNEAARATSLAVSTILAVVGANLIRRTRDDATTSGARRAFLGAGLLWWWCASIYYAGWGIDATPSATGASGSLALAMDAIAATWRADMVGVLALLLIAAAVGGRANRVALWSFATFWGTLQTAKLNVFFGVRHSGIELLPDRLAGLGVYFGPARNTVLLPLTVLALGAATYWLARRARRTSDVFHRHALAMVALLMGLAVIEHAILATSTTLPLWDFILRSDS